MVNKLNLTDTNFIFQNKPADFYKNVITLASFKKASKSIVFF